MCPYNSYLRSRLYGIVASGIIKAGCRTNKETGEIIYSKYYKIYSDRKNRMKNSRKPVYEGSDRMWCDESFARLKLVCWKMQRHFSECLRFGGIE